MIDKVKTISVSISILLISLLYLISLLILANYLGFWQAVVSTFVIVSILLKLNNKTLRWKIILITSFIILPLVIPIALGFYWWIAVLILLTILLGVAYQYDNLEAK